MPDLLRGAWSSTVPNMTYTRPALLDGHLLVSVGHNPNAGRVSVVHEPSAVYGVGPTLAAAIADFREAQRDFQAAS